MKIQTIAYLFILASLLLIGKTAESQNETGQVNVPVSNIGEVIKGISYKIDQGRSSHYIRVGQRGGKYLFLSFTTDKIYSHLKISLMVYSLQTQQLIRKCVSQEIDSCYIDQHKLTRDESLLIIVQDESKSEYQFQIKTYWSNLEHIQIGKEVKFMFSKAEQRQIYHLDIKTASFQEVKIIIKPLTRRFVFDKIKMYGTYGQDSVPTSQKHDFKSIYLWQDVQGIYLTKKEMKQTNINLILYGQIQTIYTIKCELIKETHHKISLNSKIYQYLTNRQTYDYHIQFKKQGNLSYEEYIFRVAKFTGDLNLEFYSDKEKKSKIETISPSIYMGDIQYIFKTKDIQKQYPKGIFVQASTQNKFSTYTMQFEGRMKANALELHEHIYEFLQVQNRQVLYIKLAKYQQQTNKNESSSSSIMKLIFTFLKIRGSISIQFRKCLSDELVCTGEQYLNATQKISSQLRNIGQKDIHTILIKQDFWKHVNIVEQNAILVIVMTNLNLDKNTSSFAALQYNVGNRPEFLRENKPIESHVLKDQLKIYKYVNTDPNINKIRIFINKISGEFSAYYFRELQSEQSIKNETFNQHLIYGNMYETSQQLLEKPIVVIIRGENSATYSLSVQAVHKDNEEMSSIVLSENVEFNAKIGPNKFQIFAVNPIVAFIQFNYKASGAVHHCILNEQNKCDDKKFIYRNQGQLIQEDFQGRTLLVKIRNPSSTKNIEVTAIFRSKKQKNCQIRKIGQLYRETISEGSCFSTVLSKPQDFQVAIIRQQLGNLSYTMFLCDKMLTYAIKQTGEERYGISKEAITKNCIGHNEHVFSFTTSGGIAPQPSSIQSKGPKVAVKNMHIKYLVQYKGDRIILPDGIGFHGKTIITEDKLGSFSYKLLNKINTSIVMTCEKNIYLLVKLIESSKASNTSIGANDFHFTSQKQSFYFSDNAVIKIDQDAFKKYPCKNCQLLISLYSKENLGEIAEYNLEVSQNFIMLEDGQPKNAFLTQNSLAYYGFAVKSKGQILIQASDNNQNCIEIFAGHEEYPDAKQNNVQSFDGQIFADVQADTHTYYITVRARKNCGYSILASLSKDNQNHLVKLTRGNLGYANLQQDEVKYYTFKHLSEQPFKILSLHNYGHVQFYLNKTTPEQLIKLFKETKIKYEEFTYHSSHKNRLLLDKTKSQFCKDCTYILAVLAKKHTQSSIFLGDDQTKIPLSQDKVLNDILPQLNSITKAEMYGLDQGAAQVKVHSGKLQVTLNFKQENITKTFSKNVQLQRFNFAFKSNEPKSYFARVYVTFKALQNTTVYSARIISKATIEQQKEPGIKHIKLNSQEPTYAYLQKAMQKCYEGFLKRADEKIFISFANNDRDLAKQLTIIAKLNGNFTPITKQHARNVISVKYIDAIDFKDGAIPFSICLQSANRTTSVTIIQEQETNLLPENVEMLVVKEQMYDVYPEGNMLLDVFECRGAAKVAFGQTRKQLENKKSSILQMVGMTGQPHAIRMDTRYSNVLIRVSGQLSLIRWLPINQEQEKGIGYYLYQAGKVKYNNIFGELQFLIDPIKSIKKTSTSVKTIKYNLYISNNQQQLQQASNCELFLGQTITSYHVIQEHIIDKSFKFILMKNKLIQKYDKSENLYFNVVADVVIQTPDKTEEEYRFIYNAQEIPSIVFMPNQIEKYNASILMTVLALVILLVLALAYVFKAVVIPYLGKRNRALVEENNENQNKQPEPEIKEDYLDPLPSTDRQVINMQPQTDTKM